MNRSFEKQFKTFAASQGGTTCGNKEFVRGKTRESLNSLVTETAHYEGRLKIPCGRRPQALRDQLCASITHIKTATGTRRLNNFNP